MSDPWFKFYASDWLAGTRGLTAAETGIYITLVSMMYERGAPIDMPAERLARLCGATVTNLKKAICTLIDEGKIFETEDGYWNKRVECEVQKRSAKRQSAKANAERRWGKSEQKQRDDNATALQTHSNDDATRKPDTRITPKPPLGFDEFWEKCPRKVGKGKARSAYISALKKTDAETILDGISRYSRQVSGKDAQYIAHPSSWLNAERWEDEQTPAPSQQMDEGMQFLSRVAGGRQ